MLFDDITLEIAAIERRALAAVLEKIAAQQLGEAWIGLTATGDETHCPSVVRINSLHDLPQDRPLVRGHAPNPAPG